MSNLNLDNDTQCLDALLLTLKYMLDSQDGEKKEYRILNEFEKAGMFAKVAILQNHPVKALYEQAFEILDRFYEAEVDVGI